MGLAESTRRRIAAHCAERLGCDPAAFEAPGVTVGAADESARVQILRRGGATVVGTPPDLTDPLSRRTDDLQGRPLATAGDWVALALGDDVVKESHGPTFFGYVDADAFSPAEATSGTRFLTADDRAAFEALRDDFPPGDWAQADPAFKPGETAGLFAADGLVAVATLGEPPFPHVAVAVHPDHRGRGHGRAVVSRVTEDGLDSGLVPHYRTSDAWPWSVALAESIGYERWATGALVVVDGSSDEPEGERHRRA